MNSRRKFRSQTSDNMDRWKSRGGKSQRGEEQKRDDQRRERVRRKKMQVPEKVGKSRNPVFFQWFVAPEGRKVGSLKWRVRSHVVRWEMKNCTPLWCEAHFQVKMYKTPYAETTFESCGVEKVHAIVARNTFSSQNVQSTPCWDHFWKLWCWKSARRCGAKAHFQVKMLTTCSDHFWRFRCGFAWQAQGILHLAQVSKTWGFCSMSKRDTWARCVTRWGRRFPENGCILEHEIFRFAKMIMRDRCSTSHDLASLFRGRRNSLNRWSGKIAKRIGTRPSPVLSNFNFWRKSRRIASFFFCCQLGKLRTSRRIASFVTLSRSKIEDVSQNCCVFWCCQGQELRKSRRTGSFSSLQIDTQIDRQLQLHY